MGALSISQLAANSGSSWMSQAPNLHFARQLLTAEKTYLLIHVVDKVVHCRIIILKVLSMQSFIDALFRA